MAHAYMSGFGNEFATEALPGALAQGQNSPQRCPYGLYAEQLSGTAFTAPRADNRRSWLYRIRPSVIHAHQLVACDHPFWKTAPSRVSLQKLEHYRWSAPPDPSEPTTFLEGVRTMACAGDCDLRQGMAAHLFIANRSMERDYFYNADAELLIVPQSGGLTLVTEMGVVPLEPREIGVIPRGVKFRVDVTGGVARGYLCENYGAPFRLPDLGAIGANGLANSRDFKTPAAAYEQYDGPCRLTVKWSGGFYRRDLDHSPLDVVAWHGDYAPYKYDLTTFSPLGAVAFDHPDPSIFTVLTSPSQEAGVGNVDFAIFPPRWLVAEHTFRPPWFHMNVMSEFMGLIEGEYDAKAGGFEPGGASLHTALLPHGPDAQSFERATGATLAPHKLADTLAFMFETRLAQHVTEYALSSPSRQADYSACWSGLRSHFDPGRRA